MRQQSDGTQVQHDVAAVFPESVAAVLEPLVTAVAPACELVALQAAVQAHAAVLTHREDLDRSRAAAPLGARRPRA